MSWLNLFFVSGSFLIQFNGHISAEPGIAYAGYKGPSLGEFEVQASTSLTDHDIEGEVYVINGTALLVEGFGYDGKAPDAFFWAGSSSQPDSSGSILPVDRFDEQLPLGEYDPDSNGQYIILRLPGDITTYRWISIWCQTYRVNFAHIYIPSDFTAPRPERIIPTLSGTRVRADAVYIQNNRQIYFENFYYDGSCDDAYYWVGQGSVDSSGYKALDYQFSANRTQGSSSAQDVNVHVFLPKPYGIGDISYIGIWCESSGRSLGRVTIPSERPNIPAYIEKPYLGRYISFFHMEGSAGGNEHRVRGTVYAADNRTLVIEDFTFDGLTQETFVWGSANDRLDPSGDLFRVDGRSTPLNEYEHETVYVQLPQGKTINDYRTIGIYCRRASATFGYLTVPSNFVPPSNHSLGPLTPLQHRVSAPQVRILDQRTFLFERLTYDGNGPNAYFWVGVGDTPDEKGWKAYWYREGEDPIDPYDDDSVSPSPVPSDSRGFDGNVNIYVKLPYWLTVFDIGYIGIWCIPFTADFGHVDIPARNALNIPPFADIELEGEDRYEYNCEVLLPDRFNLHWYIDEKTDEIEITMDGRVRPGEYLAFGISGSNIGSAMIGSDVTVGWVEPRDRQGGFAKDYYLSAQEQCVVTGQSGSGVCGDEYFSGTSDVSLIYAAFYNGITSITYRRPLDSGDRNADKVIPLDREVYIVWAMGPISGDNLVLNHHVHTEGNHRINFGRDGSQCPTLEPDERMFVQPWVQPQIYAPQSTTFRATIGPAGGKQGYESITGRPGWGIAWYINDILIPIITVQRGETYTFEVHGGNNQATSASSHPFYITNDPLGGYSQASEEEQQNIAIYAGPEAGPLCEWRSVNQGSPDDFDNFYDYRDSILQEQCESSSPGGTFQWTPDANTPDTVYYQCYTHRFLGWRIRVVDNLPDCAIDEYECNEVGYTRCIHNSEICDGYVDCARLEEETDCPACPANQYECQDISNRRCIYDYELCDGYDDCGRDTKEDEANCQDCAPGAFRCTAPSDRVCISEVEVCDGRADCGDGADENNCDDPCGRDPCRNGGSCFQTGTSGLVDYFCFCATEYTGNNCQILIDNEDCDDDEFECLIPGRRKCIKDWEVCDRYYDCGDGADEQTCDDKCFENPCQNGGVCFPAPRASYFCQCPAGFTGDNCQTTSSVVDCGVGYYRCRLPRPGDDPCIPLDWICDEEADCLDAADEDTQIFQCGRRECDDDEFRCGNDLCIPDGYFCDFDNDCGDNSDERNGCENYDPCADSPCNNGTCWNTGKLSYWCHCPPGAIGDNCEITGNQACSNSDFQCADGYCIPLHWYCDGVDNCDDGTDEPVDCTRCSVFDDSFRCDSGICIDDDYVCDGVDQCGDGSDERDCVDECDSDEIQCGNGECVWDLYVCDIDDDCGDGSDETNCASIPCGNNEVRCARGQCIPRSYQCDSYDDCGDGSDEMASICMVECGEGQLQCNDGRTCYDQSGRCNGVQDCPDFSDDVGCDQCQDDAFLCIDVINVCLPISYRCNNENDCEDNSDEVGCYCDPAEMFECSGGGCVLNTVVCDGNKDCFDASDEAFELCGCGLDYHRCRDPGVDFPCIPLSWICDGEIDCLDAEDEDEQLFKCGCGPEHHICENPRDGLPCFPLSWRCDGEADCLDAEDEDVELYQCERRDCSADEFQCDNGLCIQDTNFCDGDYDCGDGSDEDQCKEICADFSPDVNINNGDGPDFINYQYVRQNGLIPRISCTFTYRVEPGMRAYARMISLTGDSFELFFSPGERRYGSEVSYQAGGVPLLDVVSPGDSNVLVISLLALSPQQVGVVLALSATNEIDIPTCSGLSDLQVLDESYICDGFRHCLDGTDETDQCPCPDGEPEVACLVNPCYVAGLCAAYPDALCEPDYCGGCNFKYYDGNGQQLTQAVCDGECSADIFTCRQPRSETTRCLPLTDICDGYSDCLDAEDELGVSCERGPCDDRDFTCNNELCVSGFDLCNGINDCGDDSDESDMICGRQTPSVSATSAISIDEVFSPALEDPDSPEFQALARSIEQELINLLQSILGDLIAGITIDGFRSGSVVTLFTVITTSPDDTTDPATLQQQVQTSLESALTSAANSGTLGMFTVIPGPVEVDLSASCSLGYLTCDNGFCVSYNKQCDMVDDCGDATDEQDCGGYPCSSQPCLNGGTCLPFGEVFSCRCPQGYTGPNCQDAEPDNLCLGDNPCQNGGVCNPVPGGYWCQCPTDYAGTLCEYVNICTPNENTCQNGGSCESNPLAGGTYQCECSPGFTGDNCEFIISRDPCINQPCLNGATCYILPTDGYGCQCPPGYTGQICGNTIPADLCNPPCQNTGTCTQRTDGSYGCQCSPGFAGIDCGTLIFGDCVLPTCENGGTCIPLPADGFRCECLSGYTGQTCETVIAGICPDGESTVNCFADPCSVSSCLSYPNAQCISNYCGGCNAVFYDVNGYPIPDCNANCPPGVAVTACFADPCTVNTCPSYPNARCVFNNCAGCNAFFFNEFGLLIPECNDKCPPGIPEVACFADPCSVNICPSYPNAQCVANYCGGCHALFYDTNEVPIQNCYGPPQCLDFQFTCANGECIYAYEECDGKRDCRDGSDEHDGCRDSCPPDYPVVECLIDPCSVSSCSYPYARCDSNYCGGCYAFYYDINGHLIPECNDICLPGVPIVDCFFTDPCSVNSCPSYPNARCVANYCGGCTALYYDANGYPIRECNGPPPPQCLDFQFTCANGECIYAFEECDGKRDCRDGSDEHDGCRGICPPGVGVADCFADPCRVNSCLAYPNARCVANYCGGCNAIFFDGDGNPIRDCNNCPIEACTLNYDPLCGTDGITYGNPCQLSAAICDNSNLRLAYEGECQSDPCASRPCLNGGSCRPIGSSERISFRCVCRTGYIGRLCEIESSDCSVVCSGVRDYSPVCGSDGITYSNICELQARTTCYDPELRLLYPGECRPGNCPPGIPTVRCFADPCSVNQCPNYPDANCIASYCGGCFALFFEENGNPIPECSGCPIEICTKEYNPMCGTDSITYGNPCELSSAVCDNPSLQLAYQGECQSECPFNACTAEYAPQCGTNGVSYTNLCWLDVATCRDRSISLTREGVCRPLPSGCPIEICTQEYNPQCGRDGNTYSNPCYFDQQRCNDPDLMLAFEGICKPGCPISDCTEELRPVCATNGRTYDNLCLLNAASCYIQNLQYNHPGECGPTPRPWPVARVDTGINNVFVAEIGDSGGRRGYSGITGSPNSGSAWYINGQLIPELLVQRGSFYIFEIFGGDDDSFYITNDSVGGFRLQTREERQGVEIYAGPVDGALCEWRSVHGASADEFNTFKAFKDQRLLRTCEPGEPGTLVWKPDETTPNLVYYQSYDTKYVGWRIRVVDRIQQQPRSSSPVIAPSRIILTLTLLVVAMTTQLLWR